MPAKKKRLCFADGKVYKIAFHVEQSSDGKRWARDFEPSKTIEEARERMKAQEAENAANVGKNAISVCGSIRINMGYRVEKLQFRIVKVVREVVG